MGTDIHMQVERRLADGTWEWIKKLPPRRCAWCDGAGHYEDRPDDKCYWCGDRMQRECGEATPGSDATPYHQRHYDLFAMLADVRNGSGFAGAETGEGFRPILGEGDEALRGLPRDLSPELRYGARFELREDVARPASLGPLPPNVEEDGDENVPDFGDHSFSWLTLREILDYDWGQRTGHCGWLSGPKYRAWRASGGDSSPESEYTIGLESPVFMAGCPRVTNTQMDLLLAAGHSDEELERTFTRVEWGETYRESAGADWFRFLDALTPLGRPDDIRLVFGFDS